MLTLSRKDPSIRPDVVLSDGSPLMRRPKAPTAWESASSQTLNGGNQKDASTGVQMSGLGIDKNISNFHTSGGTPPHNLMWLLQQYDRLMNALSKEILAPHYEIATESRSRIKDGIIASHMNEKQLLKQGHYLGGLDPSIPMLTQQPTITSTCAAETAPLRSDGTGPSPLRILTSQIQRPRKQSYQSEDVPTPYARTPKRKLSVTGSPERHRLNRPLPQMGSSGEYHREDAEITVDGRSFSCFVP